MAKDDKKALQQEQQQQQEVAAVAVPAYDPMLAGMVAHGQLVASWVEWIKAMRRMMLPLFPPMMRR